jgi:hypothetical protein
MPESNEPHPQSNGTSGSSQPIVYQIRVQGQLEPQWADWFGGLVITLAENGETILTGPVADQAALYGLLKRVRDLGMELISVNWVLPGQIQAIHKEKQA